MGDPSGDFSQQYSEEKTEPFSQTEIESRLHSIRVKASDAAQQSTVPLDDLLVPPDKDIRILVRPLTRSRSVSPANLDNCEWLALRAEVADDRDQQHRVLAVTQTPRDIKFSVRMPPADGTGPLRPALWCELYYDPASDNQILLNRSEVPISLSGLSQSPASPAAEFLVVPGSSKALMPGTWRIKSDLVEVVDFRILEKRPAAVPNLDPSESSGLSELVNSSGKRSYLGNLARLSGSKKPKAANGDDGCIMFLRPRANPLVFPLPNAIGSKASSDAKGNVLPAASSLDDQTVPRRPHGNTPAVKADGRAAPPGSNENKNVVHGHTLLDLQEDEMVTIPGGCELDQYHIVKRASIASTALSSVFTAEHSDVPNGIITVKVLKTRSPATTALAKTHENERNVIRTADMWLREFQSHEDLQHEGIVRLYGGDARYLSLYMEHVDAKDLASKGTWRAPATDLFLGTRSDALRILHDIAAALHYIHNRGLVHNDIKPANILYSRERGAVLCDFGLSTFVNNPPTTGGTPYYIPPEFIGRKQRGGPSDVWALGITMLYVLHKITFPDARGGRAHPLPLYWLIADVNRAPVAGFTGPSSQPASRPAVVQMQQWLGEINEARAKLDKADMLEHLVFDMLTPQPAQRITMRNILGRLFSAAANDEETRR